jgi:predicted nucleic acid-binding Zn ribbon protein
MSRRSEQRPDPRRAGAADRDEYLYARKRAAQARARARLERRSYDPAPPREGDWTVAEEGSDGVRRISPPTPVGETVEGFLQRRGWGERLRAATAWNQWEDMVGADLAARCEPVRLAGGTLVVRAESQVWATQLRYMLPQLAARVEQVLGADTVREVRVVVGPLEGRREPERGEDGGMSHEGRGRAT